MSEKATPEQDLGECFSRNSYQFTVLGCLIAVPLSIRRKSYTPFFVSIFASTALDLLYGELWCFLSTVNGLLCSSMKFHQSREIREK